jgi:hypothetical protein
LLLGLLRPTNRDGAIRPKVDPSRQGRDFAGVTSRPASKQRKEPRRAHSDCRNREPQHLDALPDCIGDRVTPSALPERVTEDRDL